MTIAVFILILCAGAWFCFGIYLQMRDREAQRDLAGRRVIHTTVTASDINHDHEDELKAAQCDLWESEDARARMRILLTQTADALKGDPGPLLMHDWSDLPKVAGDLVAEQARLGAFLHQLAQILGIEPERAGGIAEEKMVVAAQRAAAWEAHFPDSDPGYLNDSFEFIEQRAREAEHRLAEIGSGVRS